MDVNDLDGVMGLVDGNPTLRLRSGTWKLTEKERTFLLNLDKPGRTYFKPAPGQIEIQLECHMVIYPKPAPEVGDIIYCRKCANYRVVR